MSLNLGIELIGPHNVTMTEWRNKAHAARCEGKRSFKNADLAEKSAHRASLRSRQLIISYKCYDCGFWHIGHADRSQIEANKSRLEPKIPADQPPSTPGYGGSLCLICGNEIPMDRIALARRCNTDTSVCSDACARRQKNRIARAQSKARKRARKEAAMKSSGDHPAAGGLS